MKKSQTAPLTKMEMNSILNQKKNQLKVIRLFDLLASGIGLIVLAPLLLVISALIKLDSPGPVLFKQVRVGKDNKPFRINKFRSMKHSTQLEGSLLTAEGDSRVTKIGALLRKTKLDEIPQLINVIKGDMSLVGPRPEVQKYVDHYDKHGHQVLRVRPGITDLASIEFIDESTLLGQADDVDQVYLSEILPQKQQLNYKYIRNMSFFYNLKIIFKTLAKIARR